MDKKIFSEIASIIEDIEGIDKTIKQLGEANDKVILSAVSQFEFKKKNLIKEVLAILIQSNVSASHYEELSKKIINYLKKDDAEKVISPDFIGQIRKMERMLA